MRIDLHGNNDCADDVDGFKLEVRERGECTTPAQACAASYRLRLPGGVGQTWRFGASLYSGTAVLDNYVERTDVSSQRIHITPQFERLAAGQRIGNE